MQKIIYQKQSRIFEKVVNKDDRFFRVQFIVLEREGKLFGKVISVTPITALQKGFKIYDLRFRKEAYYFPAWKHFHKVKDKGLKIKDLYISPFFDCYEFLTCIKIRAPARMI